MPTSKDFRGSGSHRQLFGPHWAPPEWHSHWVNEPGKPASQKPLTAKKQSIKSQLYTTHVGAVGWEPHSSSTTTCVGKVDHQLPVHQSKATVNVISRSLRTSDSEPLLLCPCFAARCNSTLSDVHIFEAKKRGFI